jgi:hypothetical protein
LKRTILLILVMAFKLCKAIETRLIRSSCLMGR